MTLVLACVFCVTSAGLAVYCVNAVLKQSARNDRVLSEWIGVLGETVGGVVGQAGDAIGKAVQTAQFAPPMPAPGLDELTKIIDSHLETGEQFDMSDPTDKVGWLQGPRPDVAMVDPNDDEPYGIPGLKNMHKITAPPHGGS